MYEKLTGLIAAPFTAFNSDKSVNLDIIPQLAEVLIKQNVSGAYILGTTGEGVSCSIAERKAIMSAWSKAAAGKLKLIAHVGALALPEVKELARHAVKENYFATSVVPPTYFRPGTPKVMARYLAEVAAYAPELPFYYYHTMLSRLDMSAAAILEAVEAMGGIPNLAGVKFNHHDLFDYQCARGVAGGKYDIVFGVDEFFAGALELGAEGFIGSTYNYSAHLYHAVWQAWKNNDKEIVRKNMEKICLGVKLMLKYGGLPCGKALMFLQGLDLGGVRLPLVDLTTADKKELMQLASCLNE